ncbi:MFS transporter [Pterulicium gracile]|uniref:MFS transporter n=1 Tax=Pterulicium gracile TaxID=1884261 RepID=A0A5C3QAG6_9AGAR|nr:MFS transporter [Pterula gracilis]
MNQDSVHADSPMMSPDIDTPAGNKAFAQPGTNKPSEKPIDGQVKETEAGANTSSTSSEKEHDSPDADDDQMEVQYVGGAKLILITIGLCLALFTVALDNTIIATAIPTITTRFNSLNDVGWYGSSYLLTMTSLQPTFGKIYTNFDVKITWLIALVIFEVGSVICAAASNSAMLIIGRAIAGVGASAIFSGAMNIVAFSVPLAKRPIYLASLSSMFGISSVVGPLLGGAFTDNAKLTWRWCFWINLPIGAIAFLTVVFFFKPPRRPHLEQLTFKHKIAQIDGLGALFLIGGIVCLLLALQWGGTVHPWKSARIWGLFIGFAGLIAVFVVIQLKRGDLATIPPRLIMQRTVLVSALYTAFFSMAMYIHAFYLPFYFQAIKGTSAVGSGIHTIPYLASITVSSIIVGVLITFTGIYAPFLWVGAVIFTVGCGVITLLNVDSSTGEWLGYQLIAGLGGGSSVQIPFLAVQVVLPPKDVPVGTAITMFFNSLGGAITISIAQNIFTNSLMSEIPKRAPGIPPEVVLHAGATNLRSFVPPELLDGVRKAYAEALKKTFIPPVAFGGLTVFIGLFIERRRVRAGELLAAHSG